MSLDYEGSDTPEGDGADSRGPSDSQQGAAPQVNNPAGNGEAESPVERRPNQSAGHTPPVRAAEHLTSGNIARAGATTGAGPGPRTLQIRIKKTGTNPTYRAAVVGGPKSPVPRRCGAGIVIQSPRAQQPGSPPYTPPSEQRAAIANRQSQDVQLLQDKLQKAEENYLRVKLERDELRQLLGAFERELTEVKTNREDLNDALQHALGESAAVDYNEPVGPSQRRCTQADSDRAMADNAKHAKQLASVAAKPQVFDGTSSGGRSSNVRDWLMSIEMYFKLMADIIPASQRVNTAATYLKGEALRFWHFRLKMLTPEEQTDMRVFEKALTERFDSANDPVTARYKLDKLRQGKITMRQHVQRFDTLCSYIPDMQDAEKIHRFLTSVRADCASILSSDPSTGARWVQYADLRKYALNHYAHERIFPSGAGDAGVFDQTKDAMREAAEVVQAAAGGRKRQRETGTTAGPPFKGGKGGPRGGKTAAPPGCTPENSFRDSRGRYVRRTEAIRQFCRDNNLCGICYERGHIASSCDKSKMMHGNPPGFHG